MSCGFILCIHTIPECASIDEGVGIMACRRARCSGISQGYPEKEGMEREWKHAKQVKYITQIVICK